MRRSLCVVLDIDRTLLNTEYLVRLMMREVALLIGESESKVATDAFTALFTTGSSTSISQYITATFDTETLNSVTAAVMAHPPKELYDKLLYDGVAEMIQRLDEQGIPYVCLTYGISFDQLFKIDCITRALSHEPIQVIVTNHTHKAKYIVEDWMEEGMFKIPLETAQVYEYERIVLIDDKKQNLLPAQTGIIPILVQNEHAVVEGEYSMRSINKYIQNLNDIHEWEKLSLKA